MTVRILLLASALIAAATAQALGQPGDDTIAPPMLRADVTVTGDVVRVGDIVDNAGAAAQIAIYRAPDLGTTGSLSTTQVLAVLRAHQVIGVETRDIKRIQVTRLARNLDAKELETVIAQALEHRGGLGDAANLSLTFDRDVLDTHLDAAFTGAMQPAAVHIDAHSGRFDVTIEIANESAGPSTQLRFTGTAIETFEAAVLTRNVDRTEMLKSSDVIVEKRPKADIGNDAAVRDMAVGKQMRHPMRAGQALRVADLAKPDLVQRDQEVAVIYQTAGLYLTTRGKALESGTEGDLVNVLNPQSKRTLSGTVTGRAQVTIQIATPQPEPDAAPVADETASITAPARRNTSQVTSSQVTGSQVTPNAE